MKHLTRLAVSWSSPSHGFLACSHRLKNTNRTHQPATVIIALAMSHGDVIHQELCEMKNAEQSVFLFLFNWLFFFFDLVLSVAN